MVGLVGVDVFCEDGILGRQTAFLNVHEAPSTEEPVRINLFTRIKPWLYMAAMFAGIIFMVQGIAYIQQSQLANDEQIALEELYDDEADHFMSSSLYNEYVLYSYLTTTDYE